MNLISRFVLFTSGGIGGIPSHQSFRFATVKYDIHKAKRKEGGRFCFFQVQKQRSILGRM